MARRTIQWSRRGIQGPQLMHALSGVIRDRLDGRTPLTATVMTLTLVVKDRDQEYWKTVAQQLAEHHPARILLLCASPDQDRDSLDVEMQAIIEENVKEGTPPLLMSECISMTLHGQVATYWIDWLQPLIRSNLPSYLWWTNGPPPERFRWGLLKTCFESLIIDSGEFPLSAWSQVFEASLTYGLEVRDLDWMRGEPFRLLLAQAADLPSVLQVLERPEHILVVSPLETEWPLATSWLWLSGRLHWHLERPFKPEYSDIPVERLTEDNSLWQFTREDVRLVLTRTPYLWTLHLVIENSLVREWHESTASQGSLSDIASLLTRPPDPLYRETLRQLPLEERNDLA